MQKLIKAAKPLAIVLTAFVIVVATFHLFFWNKIYPGVYVAETHIGGKTTAEALGILREKEEEAAKSQIEVRVEGKTFNLPKSEVSIKYNAIGAIDSSYSIGRGNNFLQNYREIWQSLTKSQVIPLPYSADEGTLINFIDRIDKETGTSAVPLSITLQKGKVVIDPGKAGRTFNKDELKRKIEARLANLENSPIEVSLYTTELPTNEELKVLQARAEKFIGKSITMSVDDVSIPLKDFDLVDFLNPKGGYLPEFLDKTIDNVAKQTERPAQNATFRFENDRVVEFKPAKDGLALDKEGLKKSLEEKLADLENTDTKEASVTIPVSRTQPEIQTGSVNDLGIKERIGRGTSRFRGSSASRVHNISLAASRINGTLIKPGEIFSFNGAVGDVSSLTGYKQAYVIDQGKIVLGDGGGVCQVSTTFFRSALNAGLPIVERRAHSYRVSYYEQDSSPGIDATVFTPSPDLKIKNDTPAHILIQTTFDPKAMTLAFDLYGTSDGRVATVTKPVITDVVPAPPDDMYQDDPTLPAGVVKQVNPKVPGAKATFEYKVVRGQETLQNKTFRSVYRPWQALYLRGTGGTSPVTQ